MKKKKSFLIEIEYEGGYDLKSLDINVGVEQMFLNNNINYKFDKDVNKWSITSRRIADSQYG